MIAKSEKLTVAKLVKQATKIQDRIAKERDSLRAIINDLDSILESTEEGLNEMESALDHLSEYL